jgi:hypothetical protein
MLLTLPVVCHQDMAVLILNAGAAGHEHQHMLAESVGEPRASSNAHPHGAPHLHTEATLAAPAALDALHPLSPGALQWRAYQATPSSEGVPADQAGLGLGRGLDLARPVGQDGLLRGTDMTAPDPDLGSPPTPPPRALLG